jgi:hypothetical protein
MLGVVARNKTNQKESKGELENGNWKIEKEQEKDPTLS